MKDLSTKYVYLCLINCLKIKEGYEVLTTAKAMPVSGALYARRFTKNRRTMLTHTEGQVSVLSVANSSAYKPIIYGPMDKVQEALSTCNYLLTQSWVDHHPTSKTCPYVE